MKTLANTDYKEMFTTEQEQSVIRAMRSGARVNLSFHGLTELEEVDKRMNLFSSFKKSGFSWIRQEDDYISFLKQMDNVEVSCFLKKKE